jgi:hypothetical protein
LHICWAVFLAGCYYISHQSKTEKSGNLKETEAAQECTSNLNENRKNKRIASDLHDSES